jgi:heptosyltransferase II
LDQFSRILVRAANWVGDAVMSIPALQAIRDRFPEAHITVLARPWVADLYRGAPFCDQILLYHPRPGLRDWGAKWKLSQVLRGIGFDAAFLLPNSFGAALVPFLAGIPRRIGYARDGRSLLLTDAIARPREGEIAVHERFYYLELLRRAGVLAALPDEAPIRLSVRAREYPMPVIGLSPGAAYGTAKRWLPESFAIAGVSLARQWSATVLVFGTKEEAGVCEEVAEKIRAAGVSAESLGGKTGLYEFMEHAAACRVFVTNDNGAMHIVSALGVPTVAVFGATRHTTTGPTGKRTVIVREEVDCSPYPHPCLLRECPIDHRCMMAVKPERVVSEALRIVG